MSHAKCFHPRAGCNNLAATCALLRKLLAPERPRLFSVVGCAVLRPIECRRHTPRPAQRVITRGRVIQCVTRPVGVRHRRHPPQRVPGGHRGNPGAPILIRHRPRRPTQAVREFICPQRRVASRILVLPDRRLRDGRIACPTSPESLLKAKLRTAPPSKTH
jgi:hypothetical protein